MFRRPKSASSDPLKPLPIVKTPHGLLMPCWRCNSEATLKIEADHRTQYCVIECTNRKCLNHGSKGWTYEPLDQYPVDYCLDYWTEQYKFFKGLLGNGFGVRNA